ncbi:hypothetical protein AAVH_06666 [Aphelenchoides avenae]|nr:hypothetical protein AAVH_06666 [Aphelenchus avenae]
MSSLPREVLRDVLLPLNRWALDDVQFISRRFLQLIMESMSGVCLRQLDGASYRAPDDDTDEYEYVVFQYGRPERKVSNAHEDSAQLFLEFVQALRSSHIEHLELASFIFAPEHAALVLQVPIVADTLSLIGGSCAELTATKLRRVLLHFSPTSLLLHSLFRACQISDELIRALFTNGVRFASFPNKGPVDGGSFCVTDDAIVELCVQIVRHPDNRLDTVKWTPQL